MGAVYEATHVVEGYRAAVKVLLSNTGNRQDITERFLHEGRAVSLVKHPSLVSIFEYATSTDGEPYIAMEYLDGESLRQVLNERYLGESALDIIRQLAAALDVIHKRRIIHRDLKPENVMLVKDAAAPGGIRAKLLDFGIAKLLPDGNAQGEPRSFKTRTGTMIGTPTYMSPEQCRASDPIDEKTDVYSLGVIFYEMLYGDPPIVSDSLGELFALQMFGPPPQVAERMPDLDPRLAAVVQRLLHKKPAERPTMEELLSELAAIPKTGLKDGTLADRPATRRHLRGTDAGEPPADPAASQVIRQMLSTSTGQQHRGEQMTPQPAQKRKSPIVAAALSIVSIALLAAWLLLRPHRIPDPPRAASPSTGADLGASPAAKEAPAVTAKVETAPAVHVSSVPETVPSKAEGPVRSHKDRSSRKGVRRGDKDGKRQVELWN